MKLGDEPGDVRWVLDESRAINCSKRELFAAMAMQAQISGLVSLVEERISVQEISVGWVAAADALIAALEEKS